MSETERIVRGNALNAASRIYAGTSVTAGTVIELAATFEEWIHQAGPEPDFSPQQEKANVLPQALIGCPKCGSKVSDYRAKKIEWGNDKYPDYKCTNKSCNFVQWVEEKT